MKAQRRSRDSSTLSLTLQLDGGGWLTPRPGRFTPGRETRYPFIGWTCSRAGLDGCGKSRPTGIRSPDRPVRSKSLHRLSYPYPHPRTCAETKLLICSDNFEGEGQVWGPLSLLACGYRGVPPPPPRLQRPGCKADYSPVSNVEFKNAWSYNSIPPYDFTV